MKGRTRLVHFGLGRSRETGLQQQVVCGWAIMYGSSHSAEVAWFTGCHEGYSSLTSVSL